MNYTAFAGKGWQIVVAAWRTQDNHSNLLQTPYFKPNGKQTKGQNEQLVFIMD